MDHSPPGSSIMRLSHQEYWSRLPCSPPMDLPNPGIKRTSPVAPELQVNSFTAEPPGSVQFFSYIFFNLQNDHKSGELLSWLDKTKIMRLKEANWVLTERGPLGRPHRFKCPRAHIVFIRTHRITPLVEELGVLQAWPKNTWSENIRLTGVDREVFWLCVSRQQSPKTTSGSWGWKPATDSEDRSRGRHHEQRS